MTFFFIHLSVDGHLGCFHLLSTVNITFVCKRYFWLIDNSWLAIIFFLHSEDIIPLSLVSLKKSSTSLIAARLNALYYFLDLVVFFTFVLSGFTIMGLCVVFIMFSILGDWSTSWFQFDVFHQFWKILGLYLF